MVTTRRQRVLQLDDHGASTSSSTPSKSRSAVRKATRVTGATTKAEDLSSSKPPVPKRRKTTKAATSVEPRSTHAANRRRQKDLSLFMTMPVDIVYEILSHLSPTNLLNVAALNKSWRKTLFSSQAASVWKSARDGALLICPEPPEGFTEQTWAAFLIGPASVCQNCGKRSPRLDIRDWYLVKRICSGCKRRHLVDKRLVTERRFPGVDKETLKYVPYTNDGGWDYNRSKEYYWDDEIKRTVVQRDAIADPNTRKAWEDKRIKEITNRSQMANVYRKWLHDMADLRNAQESEVRERRLECLKERFVEAGYRREDLDKALHIWSPGLHGTPNVTDAVWTRARPKLEPMVIQEMNSRMAQEMKAAVDARMKILEVRKCFDPFQTSCKS
ncbi:hypothetical protein NMY22_g14260 [Coprinellus aureogranulatus]|nr:hypothetical protein NMY22_g14260 [Coprinellus aureogranulatus]